MRRRPFLWMGIAVFILVAAGAAAVGYLRHHRAEEPPRAESVATDAPKERVVLTEGKAKAAQVRLATVERQPIQDVHVVPGRVQYDETRRVDVRTPTDGVVRKILVKPGETVERGQIVAVVHSPEAGELRADVLKSEVALELVRHERDWQAQVYGHLQELLTALRGQPNVEELEEQFTDKPLGRYWQTVFTAYSRYRLAETLNANLQQLARQGAGNRRTAMEQTTAREQAEAEYRAATEQARFEARQQLAKSEADVADAARRLLIARQKLTALLGAGGEEVETDPSAPLSLLQVRAPIAGTIEQRLVADSSRVKQSDSLLTVADTDRLWISAELREKDWPALSVQEGRELQVRIPALPGRGFPARVQFIGRTVSLETRALPLIAEIDNSEHLFRPGMFVRVLIPVGETRQPLAVPPGAVVQHEEQTFAFVPDGQNTYRAVEIHTGERNRDWVEITSGLAAGQQVVAEGTFLLKSELLLEPEE